MPRTLTTLALGALALTGCLRFGYAERPYAADGGTTHTLDAATGPFDAAAADGAAAFDAAVYGDSAVGFDAATTRDAAVVDAAARRDAAVARDASALNDASTMTSDASSTSDAASTADSGTSCVLLPASDYCTALPLLPSAPMIDGTLDCGPRLVNIAVTSWTASTAYPSDNRARYAAAWHPLGLYIYVEVDDPVLLPALIGEDPWCGDGVELYADSDGVFATEDYDQPGAMQFLATSPLGETGTTLAEDALYHTSSKKRISAWSGNHRQVKRDNGYALEALITAPNLGLTSWILSAGNKVGFDIAINVSIATESSNEPVDCGYNLGQYYLRVDCARNSCFPHTSAKAFCSASLL